MCSTGEVMCEFITYAILKGLSTFSIKSVELVSLNVSSLVFYLL